MNIFFYPASVPKHSKPYFETLQACITAKDLILLPSSSGFESLASLSLRSDDILILYAVNDDAIEHLLAMQNDLKDFRVLLLLSPKCSREHRDSAYELSPIFVAEPTDFTELSAVATNILLRDDDEVWSLSHSQKVI